jgi:hypothetical protein
MVLWATLLVALFGIRPALCASYTSDTSYQFSGQTSLNSGQGVAVNSADTRLYEIERSSSTGSIRILDTASGAQVGSITPPAPTTIYDVALSPDNATVYFARPASAGGYEVAAAPASDGAHPATEVTTAIAGIDNKPSSIVVVASGADTYLGVVTDQSFLIFQKPSGGALALVRTIDIGYTTMVRDVAALDSGSGIEFYILKPTLTSAPNVQVYALDGTPRAVSFAALPAGFDGYTFDSITAASSVDGEPSLFIAADTIDPDTYVGYLTVFRYTATGAYAKDGFGYQLSATTPLSQLQTLGTDPVVAPGAIVGNHLYLGAIVPGRFSDGPQTARILIEQNTATLRNILGTVSVTVPSPQPAAQAAVVIAGRSLPKTTTSADGTYTLGPLPANTYKIGAWKYGYVAASKNITLTSEADALNVNLTLPDTVPTFDLAPAFAPPAMDGQTFTGEYPTPPMPFYQLGGAAVDDAIATTAFVTHDADTLYVMVRGGEPSLSLNSATSTNVNMITVDDNVQILLDPTHRHDAQAESNQLYQFVVNIPPFLNGTQFGQSYRYQRRIDADGLTAGTVDPTAWTSRVGYSADGWILEARINLIALGIQQTPGPDAVWGVLIGRNRPTQHHDSLPTQLSTSPRQVTRLTAPNTWTDAKFVQIVTTVAGDVNHNGVVDVNDAVLTLRMAGGLSFGAPNGQTDPNTVYRQNILEAADVWPKGAPDGAITLADALRLVRTAAGKETLP